MSIKGAGNSLVGFALLGALVGVAIVTGRFVVGKAGGR